MTWLWPEMLWLLVLVPALVAAYVILLRRKQRSALRYASLSVMRDALGASHRLRRHVPPLMFLAAFTLMILAIARPAAGPTRATNSSRTRFHAASSNAPSAFPCGATAERNVCFATACRK